MTKKGKVAALGVLTAVLLVVGGNGLYEQMESNRRAAEAVKALAARQAAALQQQREDENAVKALAGPVVRSRWLEDEFKVVREAIKKSEPALLVLPLMNTPDKPGLDPSARVMFARALAGAVAGNDPAKTVDPGLVFAAIGEPRSLRDDEARIALRPLTEGPVVTGNVARESDGRFVVSLTKTTRTGTPVVFEARDLTLADGEPPERVLKRVIPDALKALQMDPTPLTKALVQARPPLSLPASPMAAATASVDPITGLWLLQLFAALHNRSPDAMPRPRERIHERTLAALDALDTDSADYALLEARALLYLGRRPAAIKALDRAPQGAETEALRAYADADLRALKLANTRISRPVAKLIAELELLSLRHSAGDLERPELRKEAERIAHGLPPSWRALVTLFARSFDSWDYPPAWEVKEFLDRDFPLEGDSMRDLVRAKAALGSSGFDAKTEAEMTLSPLVHVRKWRDRNADKLCCGFNLGGLARPEISVYLGLLENHAETFLIGHLDFLSTTQGLPDEALNMIRLLYELSFTGGHPGMEIQRLRAIEGKMAQGLSADVNMTLIEEQFDAARKVVSWMPYQSYFAARAMKFRMLRFHGLRVGRQIIPVRYPQAEEDPFNLDVPARAMHLEVIFRGGAAGLSQMDARVPQSRVVRARPLVAEACVIAVDDFDPCLEYFGWLKGEPVDAVLAQAERQLQKRFAGNAQRAVLLAALLKQNDRRADAKALLQQEVSSPSRAEEVFKNLGALQRDDGEYKAAARTYLAYPALAEIAENTVGTSNYAYGAAYGLLVPGAAADAERLLAIAASHRDGSYANLSAQAQLAITRGDVAAAIGPLQSSYQRYQDSGTARQISSALFFLGHSEAAWGALKQVSSVWPGSGALHAASVGWRMSAASPIAMADWVTSANASPYRAVYVAFEALAVDRGPGFIDQFLDVDSRLVGRKAGGRGSDLREASLKITQRSTWPRGAFRAVALGYPSFLAGQYAEALKELSVLAPLYGRDVISEPDARQPGLWTGMPYLAYALAKSGRMDEARALAPRLAPEFERTLVRAITTALSGNHADAQRLLTLARAATADPEYHQIPPCYIFVEIAERLAAETAQPEYLRIAVEFARGYQRFEPWAAWAYAYEAKYATEPDRKLRAAAIALRLDPASQRLNSLSPEFLARAKAWSEKNRPFEVKRLAPGPRI